MQQPLTKLGIDSLMAVELKNRVESDLGLIVPVTALLEGPSLAQLSARLVTQLPAPVAESAAAVPAVAASAGAGVAGGWSPTGYNAELLSKVDDLSDDAVDSLLRTMGIDDGAEGQHSQESGG